MRLPSIIKPTLFFGLMALTTFSMGACGLDSDEWPKAYAPEPTPRIPNIIIDTEETPSDEVIAVIPDLDQQYVQPSSLDLASDPSIDLAGDTDQRCHVVTIPGTEEDEEENQITLCRDSLNLCQEILLPSYREKLLADLGWELGAWDFLAGDELEPVKVTDLLCEGVCDDAHPPAIDLDVTDDSTGKLVFRHAHISDLHGSVLFHPGSGAALDGPSAKSWARPLSLSPNALAHLMSQFHHDIEALGVYWVSVTGDMGDGLGKHEAGLMAKMVYGGADIDEQALVVTDPLHGYSGNASMIYAGAGHYDYYPVHITHSSAIKGAVPGNHMNPWGNFGLIDPDHAGAYADFAQTWNGFLYYVFSMERYFFGSGIQYIWTDDEELKEQYVVSTSSYLPTSEDNAPVRIDDWVKIYQDTMDSSTSAVVSSMDDRTVYDQRGNWAVDLSQLTYQSGHLPVPFHMINVNTVFPLLWQGVLTAGTRQFIREECQYARDHGLIAVIASHHGLDDIWLDLDGSGEISSDLIDFTSLLSIEDLLYGIELPDDLPETVPDIEELALYVEEMIAQYGINTDETIADIVAQTRVVAVNVVGHDHMNDYKIRYGRTLSPDQRQPEFENPFEEIPVRPMLESHAPSVGINGSYVLSDFYFVPESGGQAAYLYIDRKLADIQRDADSDFAQLMDLDSITGCGIDAEPRKGGKADKRGRFYLSIPNETYEDHEYYQALVEQLTAVSSDDDFQQ